MRLEWAQQALPDAAGDFTLMQIRTPQPGPAAAPAVLGKVNGLGVQSLPEVKPGNSAPAPRRSAYGLPCAKCNMYYEADLPACPICKSPQRVSATSAAVTVAPELPSSAASKTMPNVLPGLDEAAPAPEVLEEERERFLKELKNQIYQAHTQINAGPAGALAGRCSRETSHPETQGPAEICRACFDQAQESSDRMEAALHMDLKEATKIIYDAVWADTSDPQKTYINAAQAIVSELRNRAGISAVPGGQKYSH